MDRHSIAQFRTATDIVTRQLAADLTFCRPAGIDPGPPRPAAACRDTRLIDDLKARRQALGCTLSEVGERCGIEEQSLVDWECGIAAPRLDAAQRWAAALGLHVMLVPADAAARRGLRVEWQERRIAVDGTPVRLTPMEWKALERLARTPGEVVTHRALFHHLYGDERHYRSQSTAIRVLITKLRRLLPLRIEAQWGKGYVVSGLEPSQPQAPSAGDRGAGDRAAGAACAAPRTMVAAPAMKARCERAAAPRPAAATRPGDAIAIDERRMSRIAPPPVRHGPCRAEELGVIERFLAERGVTRCPDVATIEQSPLPTLVWDKVKRKWVRPAASGCQAG